MTEKILFTFSSSTWQTVFCTWILLSSPFFSLSCLSSKLRDNKGLGPSAMCANTHVQIHVSLGLIEAIVIHNLRGNFVLTILVKDGVILKFFYFTIIFIITFVIYSTLILTWTVKKSVLNFNYIFVNEKINIPHQELYSYSLINDWMIAQV